MRTLLRNNILSIRDTGAQCPCAALNPNIVDRFASCFALQPSRTALHNNIFSIRDADAQCFSAALNSNIVDRCASCFGLCPSSQFCPHAIDTLTIPLKSFKIRYDKVLKVLKGTDSSKSANGIAPVFWKMTGG